MRRKDMKTDARKRAESSPQMGSETDDLSPQKSTSEPLPASKMKTDVNTYSAAQQILMQLQACEALSSMLKDGNLKNQTIKMCSSDSIRVRESTEVKNAQGGLTRKEKTTGVSMGEAEQFAYPDDLSTFDKAYKDALEKSTGSGQDRSVVIQLQDGHDRFIEILPRLGEQRLVGELFIDKKILDNLNFRERVIIADIIFDQAMQHSATRPPSTDKNDNPKQHIIAASHAYGSTFSKCLYDKSYINLGLQDAGNFRPSEKFMDNLADRYQCLLMLKNIVDLSNNKDFAAYSKKHLTPLLNSCLNALMAPDVEQREMINKVREALKKGIQELQRGKSAVSGNKQGDLMQSLIALDGGIAKLAEQIAARENTKEQAWRQKYNYTK